MLMTFQMLYPPPQKCLQMTLNYTMRLKILTTVRSSFKVSLLATRTTLAGHFFTNSGQTYKLPEDLVSALSVAGYHQEKTLRVLPISEEDWTTKYTIPSIPSKSYLLFFGACHSQLHLHPLTFFKHNWDFGTKSWVIFRRLCVWNFIRKVGVLL